MKNLMDAYIALNPKHWHGIQAMTREHLERTLVALYVQRQEAHERTKRNLPITRSPQPASHRGEHLARTCRPGGPGVNLSAWKSVGVRVVCTDALPPEGTSGLDKHSSALTTTRNQSGERLPAPRSPANRCGLRPRKSQASNTSWLAPRSARAGSEQLGGFGGGGVESRHAPDVRRGQTRHASLSARGWHDQTRSRGSVRPTVPFGPTRLCRAGPPAGGTRPR